MGTGEVGPGNKRRELLELALMAGGFSKSEHQQSTDRDKRPTPFGASCTPGGGDLPYVWVRNPSLPGKRQSARFTRCVRLDSFPGDPVWVVGASQQKPWSHLTRTEPSSHMQDRSMAVMSSRSRAEGLATSPGSSHRAPSF